jgi:hypothetical protein
VKNAGFRVFKSVFKIVIILPVGSTGRKIKPGMIAPATFAANVVIGIGQGQPQVVVLFGPKRITIKVTAEASLVAVPVIRILA